jgi:hypothetical protein
VGWGMYGGKWLFIILALWELAWKGMGLWKAAQIKKKEWFIAMLLLNTAGILPIVYLNWFSKDKKKGKK